MAIERYKRKYYAVRKEAIPMYSFDETQCHVSKQKGVKNHEKTNNSGIAVRCITADTVG